MAIHRDHILTTDMREAYDFLLRIGEADPGFDVTEVGPSPKRSVRYKYCGQTANPFSFIVNSGARKDYHLFYLRHPQKGDLATVAKYFDRQAINTNSKGEITIQIKNRLDAQKVWEVVNRTRLK